MEGEETLNITRPDTTEEVWSPDDRESWGPNKGKTANVGPQSTTLIAGFGCGKGLGYRNHAGDLGKPPAVACVNFKKGLDLQALGGGACLRPTSPG